MISTYFPEIDAEGAVRRMLRNGLTMEENEVSPKARDKLLDLGLIEVKEGRYVVCADPNHEIDEWHPDPSCRKEIRYKGSGEIHECDECGNVVAEIKEDQPVYRRYTFYRKPEGIFDYLKNALSVLSDVKSTEKAGMGALNVKLDKGNELVVALPEWAEQEFLSRGPFFSDPTLYVHLDQINRMPTVLEETTHVHLSDLLIRSKGWLEEQLEVASTPIPKHSSLRHLVKQFDTVVERHVDPNVTLQQGDFFEYFCRDLLSHLKNHPEKTNDYLRSLSRMRGTAFGEMHIKVGGSGNTDIIPVDRYEMFNQLCEGSFISDAKCKISTGLTKNDILTVNGHLTTNHWDADHAVVILASEEIADNAWDFVAEARRNNGGRWKIMLVPKFALIELIHAVDAEYLFEAVMDEDRTDLFFPGDDKYEDILDKRSGLSST
jgi:hypothetical protein